jgi:hypothetical protein
MLGRVLPSVLLLVACSNPLEPSQTDTPLPHSRGLSFTGLRSGDTLLVDQHSVGCFMVSDAHLMFVGTLDGAVLSGELRVADRRASIPIRYLTAPDLRRLDNLLELYRREEHQTRCMSTGLHSTRFDARGSLSEQHETNSCIEMEFVEAGTGSSVRPRADIMMFYEFTEPAFDALLRSYRERPGA